MFKYLNRGISTPIAIGIIAVLVILVGGGILAYQYYYIQKEETKIKEISIQKPNLVITGESLSKVQIYMVPTGTGIDPETMSRIENATKQSENNGEQIWIYQYPKDLLITNIFAKGFDNKGNLVGRIDLPIVGATALWNALYENTEETANWKTYRNDEYGFEIKYPNNWTVDDSHSATSINFTFRNQNESANFDIMRLVGTGEENIKSAEEDIDYNISVMKNIIQPKKKITIGGYDAYEVIGTLCTRTCNGSSEEIYTPFSVISISANNKISKIEYVEGISGVGWKENIKDWKYYDEFKKIISTFKFSESLPPPNTQAAVITSVNLTLVRVGSDIIIKGSKFSDNRNVVSLTPNDTSLLPAYNINAYKITSTSNGTEITITITPENFEYGDCRSPGGMCQGELGKIPDGVYDLSILNGICTGYNCESNKVSLAIVNQ